MNVRGFTVVEGILTSDECERLVALLQSDAKHAHAHSDLLWSIRCDERIREAFARAWDMDKSDLICGFDGAFYTPNWITDGMPWHADQDGSHPPGMACVQGLLTLLDVSDETGGTVLLEGSHKYHRATAARNCHSCGGWEYFEVPNDDFIFRRGLQTVMPQLKRGSLLLWDSRVLHCVKPPMAPCARAVVYLSMAPRSHAPESVLQARRRAYKMGISTTHWPTVFVDRMGPRQKPSVSYQRAPPQRKHLIG